MVVAEREIIEAAAVPSVPSGPRMPRRTEWVSLPAPYDQMQLLVWTNYPHAIGNALRGLKGTDAFKEALAAVCIEHNGWVADDGTPLGPMDAEFWWGDNISDELVGVVLVVLGEVPQRFPKEMRKNGAP